jgi:hypothetical protein
LKPSFELRKHLRSPGCSCVSPHERRYQLRLIVAGLQSIDNFDHSMRSSVTPRAPSERFQEKQ